MKGLTFFLLASTQQHRCSGFLAFNRVSRHSIVRDSYAPGSWQKQVAVEKTPVLNVPETTADGIEDAEPEEELTEFSGAFSDPVKAAEDDATEASSVEPVDAHEAAASTEGATTTIATGLEADESSSLEELEMFEEISAISPSAAVTASPSSSTNCDIDLGPIRTLVKEAFGESALVGRPVTVNAATLAAACAPGVVWDDRCEPETFRGTDAVRNMISNKFPDKRCRLVIERVADGIDGKGGFTWHREKEGKEGEIGLRGITYVETTTDEQGRVMISRAVESAEPLTKPGKLTADLFAAVVKDLPKNPKGLTYTPRVPTGCSDLVAYIWNEAYPAGAEPSVAMEYFDDSIVYEDCNYDAPFVGKSEVGSMVEDYDLGGIEWLLENTSTDKDACCFTWRIKINGQEAADGVSFYDTRGSKEGKVTFIRDIPSPLVKPAPLQRLAAFVNPQLRVFAPLQEGPGGRFVDGVYVPGRMQGQVATFFDRLKESNPVVREYFEPAGLLMPAKENEA